MGGNQPLNKKQNDASVGYSNKHKVVKPGKFDNGYLKSLISGINKVIVSRRG